MSDINFKKEAINYSSAHHMTLDKICEPLKPLGITSFFYQRYYTNKTFSISNHHEWTRNFIEHDIHNIFQPVLKSQLYETPFVSSTTITDKNAFFNAFLLDSKFSSEKTLATKYFHILKHFKIHKIIASLHHHTDHVEIIGFATDKKDVNLDMVVINNPEIIARFHLYFKDKANDIISKKAVFFPSPLIVSKKPMAKSQAIRDFIEKTKFNKIYINYDSRDICLSYKEISVLNYLSKGKSAKEIASELSISPKTAEYHLDNIRKKTGLYHRSQLVSLHDSKFNIISSQ